MNMPRIKDVNNPKKRKKSVSLDKESFLIMEQVDKLSTNFNFSKFVNQQIKRRFKNLGEEQILHEQLEILIDEQNEQWEKKNLEKLQIINELKEIRAKKQIEIVELPIEVSV